MKKTKMDLEKVTVEILEKTKRNIKEYGDIRKVLFNYYNSSNPNLDEWEKYILETENMIKEN